MTPTLEVIDAEHGIVLAVDIPSRWAHARAKEDMRTWRALGVYLFDLAVCLTRGGLHAIAEDHDALAMVAMQRSYGMQPPRLVDTFA